MRAFQFIVSVAAAWWFVREFADAELTPAATFLGVLVVGIGAAYLSTVVIVRLRDAIQRWTR